MTEYQVEYVWGESSDVVNFAELSQVCGLSAAELDELVEYGALLPLDPGEQERRFKSACIPSLRTANTLRRDFDLDMFAVSFLLDYLLRIEALEEQVRLLKAHVSPQTLSPIND